MIPAQAADYRRTVLNYLQAIGFTFDEALRLMPEDDSKLFAFRMSFMVNPDREVPTTLRDLS